jgi:hypothetical protein
MSLKTTKDFNLLLTDAVKKWGTDRQIEQIVEECAELIMAIQKYKRYKDSRPEDYDKLIDNVREEIADVLIITLQGRMMFVLRKTILFEIKSHSILQ